MAGLKDQMLWSVAKRKVKYCRKKRKEKNLEPGMASLYMKKIVTMTGGWSRQSAELKQTHQA